MRRLLPVLLLAACSAAPDLDPRLEPLAGADLVPGRGLGDVVLGETTLGEFHARYGAKRVSLVMGDDFAAYELTFAGGQLAFLFPLDPEYAFSHGPELRGGVRDLEEVVFAHAPVRDARVTSLSVRSGRSDDATVYRGALPSGVRLGMTAEEAVPGLAGSPVTAGRPFLAGAGRREPDRSVVDGARGVLVDFRRDGDDVEDPLRVWRIALFRPGDGASQG